MLVISGGTVVTGDGSTLLESHDIVVDDAGVITSVTPHDPARAGLDASGCFVLPGLINAHAHGCSIGPLFSSGAPPLSLEQALRNADRQLREGVTTLVNVDGLPLWEEVQAVASRHPLRILAGTSHVPSTFASARSVDGGGLKPAHLETLASSMLASGAVALGEMGSGATLGGGVSSYKYLPETLERLTGVRVDAAGATRLKRAVLGRHADPAACDLAEVERVLTELGLDLSVEKAREVVEDIAYRPVAQALLSFDEACELSAATGIPVIFHSAPPSAKHLLELGRRYQGTGAVLVAGHCNHPDFTASECVATATACRELGVVVDVSTVDGVSTRHLTTMDNIELLAREGLVDTISTDYGGGNWDGILECLQALVVSGLASVPQAVAWGTSAVARVFPRAAPSRGLVQAGMVADLVTVERYNLGRVRSVVIGGRIVVKDGWRVE